MSDPIRTFRVVSFGCKVNQTEGLALADRLRRLGLREAGPRRPADLVIINTCTVTAEADRQGRQRLRRAARRGAAVAVTGCGVHPAAGGEVLEGVADPLAADADKDRLLARLQDAGHLPAPGPADDRAPGNRAARRPSHIARRPSQAAAESVADDVVASEGHHAGAPTEPPADAASQPRSRAMLKVQDGCPGGCTYCIVPMVRPDVRSVPMRDVVRQAEALVAEGFREIVLCGIHLGLYGTDLAPGAPAPTLVTLLARLLAVDGLGRLRLSSLSPAEVDDALLGLMAAEPDRLCPHLHLSLQSGDDEVLARMGRPYTRSEFLRTVARVREALDEPALTSDVLVGFPGETEEAFEHTLRTCREAGFARMHVFPFSPRPGTRAIEMPGRVPPKAVRERCRRAAELGEDLAAACRHRLVGRDEQVAVESVRRDGAAEGLAARYVRVRIPGPLPGGAGPCDLVAVRLVGVKGDVLQARPEA